MKRLLFAAALVTSALMAGGIATAGAATVTVGEGDVARQPENTAPTRNWVIYNRNGGTATFRNGPATPPLGFGSVELSTPTSADKIQVFNYDHVGTPLADVDAMGYSTYRTAGSLLQDTALNIEVDVNGSAAGGFTTLVFEPVYNTDQGVVTSNTWQTWDAYNGASAKWWSTKPIP